MRHQPAIDHLRRQRARVPLPQRKQRRDAGARKLPLAIGADVGQEQIAERHCRNAVRLRLGDEAAHDAFVVGIRTGIGNVDRVQRQARSLCLRLQQRAPHGVHGHAVEGGVDRGEQPGHLVLTASPQHLQAPRRVLARTPAQPRLHQELFLLL